MDFSFVNLFFFRLERPAEDSFELPEKCTKHNNKRFNCMSIDFEDVKGKLLHFFYELLIKNLLFNQTSGTDYSNLTKREIRENFWLNSSKPFHPRDVQNHPCKLFESCKNFKHDPVNKILTKNLSLPGKFTIPC